MNIETAIGSYRINCTGFDEVVTVTERDPIFSMNLTKAGAPV